jgi:hypothetical protein
MCLLQRGLLPPDPGCRGLQLLQQQQALAGACQLLTRWYGHGREQQQRLQQQKQRKLSLVVNRLTCIQCLNLTASC